MNETPADNNTTPAIKNDGVGIYGKINTVCLIIIASVSITLALIYTKTILIPLVISAFVYTMMTPVIRYIKFKFRLPKWLSIVIAAALVLTPLVLLTAYLFYSAAHFVRLAVTYQERLQEIYQLFITAAGKYHIPVPEEFTELTSFQEFASGPYATNLVKGFGGAALHMFSYVLLVIVFVFFLLVGSGSTKITNTIIKEIQNKISAYLYIHIVISLLTGFCVGVVLLSTGLELAVTFAVLTVILNFIPNVGSVIAVMLPLPIAFIQFGPSAQFFVILAFPAMIQFTLGSILEPKLLGNGMDLHPVAVIGSLVFWALVWGIPGAFLAVPITAAIRIILSKLEPTRPFAEILAGRLPR